MALELITEPTLTILTTTETKNYLKVDHSVDDTLIADMIKASQSFIETETGIAVCPQTWQQFEEGGCETIELIKQPIISVDEIKYFDDFDEMTGSLLTVSIDFRLAGNILIHEDAYWEKQRAVDGYVIKYTAGLFTSSNYTSSTDPRLSTFKICALRFAAWLYENREMYITEINESFQIKYDQTRIPQEIIRMLRPHSVITGI